MANTAKIPGIKPPSSLSFGQTPAKNWKLFLQKWNIYVTLSGLAEKEKVFQVAMFLSTLSDEALEIYNGFTFTSSEADRTVKEITDKFNSYAIGEINETYERFLLNKRHQLDGETFESYYASICSLIKTCNYCMNCIDSILRDRIVLGVKDSATQTELLKLRDLTLKTAVDTCKAAETVSAHSIAMHKSESETVNKIKLHVKKKAPMKYSSKPKCKFCDNNHEFKKELCPAYGKICTRCGGKNHYAAVCKNKPKNRSQKDTVNIIDDSDCEWILGIQDQDRVAPVRRDLKCKMYIRNTPVSLQIDTGATVNILPVRYAGKILPTKRVLRMWNNDVVQPLGTCRETVYNPKNKMNSSVEFIVCENNFTPLLGLAASQKLELLTIRNENIDSVSIVKCEDFNDVYTKTLGTLPGTQSLTVDSTVKPVVMPTRRIPIALYDKLKCELERLCDINVIAKVDEPTDWVSQIVVVQKKDLSLRVCIDPHALNKALQRERYTLPILSDSLHELSNSKVFTKVDLSSGYWHVKLDDVSSHLTTFQTNWGRYRWLRLPFGLSVSSEIFQKRLMEAFEQLSGVICVADDVIIHGKNMAEHDDNLVKFLQRCREKGIKLNSDKMRLRSDNITFMGHCVTKHGLSIDPTKVSAINDLPSPTNIEELRRFTGMVNFVSRYIPNLSDVLVPLNNLLRKDVIWNWANCQEQAFNKIKRLLVKSPVLAIYDPSKELILENDASNYGLGSALWQQGRPIGYVSRTLSPAEKNYAQIEKELLAVLFGLEKFHHYTFGRCTHIITDHKPLVSINVKPLYKAPKRLQSLLLRMQMYNNIMSFKPGKDIPVADMLSRAPITSPQKDTETINIVMYTPVHSSTLDEVRGATSTDETLTSLGQTIRSGWPDDKSAVSPSLRLYFSYRDELSIVNGIIYRGARIVIPISMRQKVKQRVHAGHLGINSSLRRARDVMFWPGMSSDIRQYIESCGVCASYCDKQPEQSLKMTDVPERPWQKVASDLFSLKGRDYLVTVDYFSGFFEVDHLTETTSDIIVMKMKLHFARHGIPDIVTSDNGPQFSSELFRKFSKAWNFHHYLISPGNSRANGAAEAAVKIAKRLMMKCFDSEQDIHLGLLNLRNTPQEGLTTSPAQRLFGRRTKTLLPTAHDSLVPSNVHMSDVNLQTERKLATASKSHSDTCRDLKPLQTGDTVRVQPIRPGVKTWEEGKITKQLTNRSYEVETDKGRKLRRNRQFLRSSEPSTHSELVKPAQVSSRASAHIQDTLVPTEQIVVPNSPIKNTASPVVTSPTIRTPQNIEHSLKTNVAPTEPIAPIKTRSGRVINKPERLTL